MNHDEFWSQIKDNLKSKNQNNRPLHMWFDPTILLGVENRPSGTCFRLGVPTELHKYWISQNLLDRICSEISALYPQAFTVEVAVFGQEQVQNQEINRNSTHTESSTNPSPENIKPLTGSLLLENEKSSSWSPNLQPTTSPYPRDGINFDYTFSTFVVGRNNEFAHAACFNVAENPGGKINNPLFICGPTGMGKTHLLNAVGNHIREKYPETKISYVSAERFLNECVSSIRRNEMDKFRQRYRENSDIILMDDIQILGRGEAVQEEFFHTLNYSFEKHKQVVVASDRMPKDIKSLEDRIRTRLEWGLIADIQMPDIETRVAILKYKAERRSIPLSNEVVSYIARVSKRSIRELEGNLNKLKMYSELQGLPISLDLARRVLTHHDDVGTISIEEIQKIVSEHYQVRMVDLKSKIRTKPLVTARQVAMYLIKKHLDRPLVDIGKAFGGKDHTTVINALRRVDYQQSKNLEIKSDIEELDIRIHNITGV
ncbi:MAG: chromosomal replication initiator protein DnaA [Bdellovibrionales bacterium]|nr:chromosomal replication initiator protein DnaA [Bdellovibrionales bacterium]